LVCPVLSDDYFFAPIIKSAIPKHRIQSFHEPSLRIPFAKHNRLLISFRPFHCLHLSHSEFSLVHTAVPMCLYGERTLLFSGQGSRISPVTIPPGHLLIHTGLQSDGLGRSV